VDKDLITTEELRKQEPEKYFQGVLEVSEFNELNRLVEDSNRKISWDKLAEEWVVKIENKKIEWIYWKWKLNLSWTRIKSLWKLKKVNWNLYLENLKTLKGIWELEEVAWDLYLRWGIVELQCEVIDKLKIWKLKITDRIEFWWKVGWIEKLLEYEEIPWNLDLIWTEVKNLWKVRKINWTLYCRNIKTLEDSWELEEVNWNLYINWTSFELHIDIINKIKTEKIKVKNEVFFGWEIEWIERVLEYEEIPWNLDLEWIRIKSLWKLKKVKWNLYCSRIKGLEDLWDLERVWFNLALDLSSIDLQIEALSKIDRTELAVWSLTVDKWIEEIFNKIYQEWNLNIKNFRKIFGEDIEKIEDEDLKKTVILILNYEYKKKRREIERKWNKIIEENKGRELSEEKKKELRDKMKALDIELITTKDKIESFGIKIDDL